MKRAGVECKRCGGQILGDSCLQCGYQTVHAGRNPYEDLMQHLPQHGPKQTLDQLPQYVAKKGRRKPEAYFEAAS